jgi:hypothetical protein
MYINVFLTPAVVEKVSGNIHTPAALFQGKELPVPIGGCCGYRCVLKFVPKKWIYLVRDVIRW